MTGLKTWFEGRSLRERRLLLGDTGHDHLLPEDGPSRARAGMLVVRRADS